MFFSMHHQAAEPVAGDRFCNVDQGEATGSPADIDPDLHHPSIIQPNRDPCFQHLKVDADSNGGQMGG
ncbi:MAG: hypothetical protein CL798_02415 [Chromatiales bacterium]|jgi:hypothetical protein|nr:hypothetical protein [Chromatiales bacterium]